MLFDWKKSVDESRLKGFLETHCKVNNLLCKFLINYKKKFYKISLIEQLRLGWCYIVKNKY